MHLYIEGRCDRSTWDSKRWRMGSADGFVVRGKLLRYKSYEYLKLDF
jgi:hypothetical protein